MTRTLLTVGFLALMATPLLAAGRPMTAADLLAVKGVADPQVSPDGKLVAYVLTTIDPAANKSNSDVWVVPVAGGEPKRLTTSAGADNHPRWAPDGKSIAFVSTRGGSSQIWLLPIDGGEARQLTQLPIDVGGPVWSPTGDKLAVVASVYPGKTPEETAAIDKEKEANPSKARVYDELMIRHWDAWDEGKRSHPFVVDAATGEARDLVPGWKANVPPAPFGGSTDYAWSPDGEELAFASEPLENMAWSTNTDVWTVPAAGGEPTNRTSANEGADGQPAYSPDGRFLAYVSQKRAGFEADQWVLKALPRSGGGEPIALSGGIDRPVQSFTWDRDKPELLAIVDDGGYESVWSVPVLARRAPVPILKGATCTATQRAGEGELVVVRTAANKPAELYRAVGDEVTPLTHHNDELVAQLDLPAAERFAFEGAGGDEVQGWLVKPPGFDPAKKYPVVFLIHGGPQGAWHDEWHNRWNYALFAAPGYAVVAINPRGSTGFGQGFTDAISRDWNGKVVDDLMRGLDAALSKYPFLDADKIAAAGGSYGGYMVNWIAGHSDRFQALISHAGIYDLTSMNATTEELWFPEWEFGGSPWKTPERHVEQSPSTYAGAFKTPTLVIHGALDFRVPDAQGLGMFTALQRNGVPSRYLWFPDEGHWISKPANRTTWWREVHGWLERHLK